MEVRHNQSSDSHHDDDGPIAENALQNQIDKVLLTEHEELQQEAVDLKQKLIVKDQELAKLREEYVNLEKEFLAMSANPG